jgi:GT2 family glycosyltransferase
MLGLCLERLAPGRQSISSDHYEVIVTDDGKTDDAEIFCMEHFPFVCYTKGPGKGPAANRNNGARLAAGDWLVFTDDDCLPDADWLQAYADAIKLFPESKAFEGAILPDNWELLKKDMAECPVNVKGECFWSANIAVEKSLFWAIDAFDERFTFAAQEDQDLYFRLNKITTIPFVANAKVVHPVRVGSLRKIMKYAERRILNWLIYAAKKTGKTKRNLLVKASGDLLKQSMYDAFHLKPKSAFSKIWKSWICLKLAITNNGLFT